MPSFVDTTVVVEAGENSEDWLGHFKPHLEAEPPAEIPHYAFRELSAGLLQTLATAHNRLVQTASPAEAMQQVLRLPQVVGRTREGQLKALVTALAEALGLPGNAKEPMYTSARRQMCQSLSIIVAKLWRNARNQSCTRHVQPLGCFGSGELTLDGKLIAGPQGRWECDKNSRCAAAEYLHEKPGEMAKIVQFLQAAGDAKRETVQRRKALKDLTENGPIKFNKRGCRALGDAYFAIMCPPGSVVVTTNLVDHEPLAKSVGKTAINPKKQQSR